MTLCIVHQHPRVLLGKKKVRLGAGRWNGFGGKVKEGETHEACVVREAKEEAGIDIKNPKKMGVIEFEFASSRGDFLEVHIFRASEFSGEPCDSDEMENVQWFFVDEIPFREMWPDDVYWLPLFLKGRTFKGRFLFGEGDAILERELKEVAAL
jgi:8-oxo-dGTP diphosphatase/2-hydroxy-dATP diphosphatase